MNKKLLLAVVIGAISVAGFFGCPERSRQCICRHTVSTVTIPATSSEPQTNSAANSTTNSFTGSVKGADGKKLNGVFVSAKREQDIFTTTVYSDDAGQFHFPPLEAGTYTITAHTGGFRASQHNAKIVGNGHTAPLNFTLLIEDRPDVLVEQATAGEWLNSGARD